MENIKLDFSKSPKVSNLKIVLVILGIPIAVLSVLALGKFVPSLYNWLPNITGRFITQTLVTYLILYLVFIYLLLIKGSKIKPIELGLDKSKLKSGILLTLALFLILQLYGALYSYFVFGKLIVAQGMTKWTAVAGNYIALFFGVALFEEVVFRGFLIPQVFIRLNSNKTKRSKMILALVISQVLFSLVHIPIRLVNGIDIVTLIISLCALFIIGVVFAFIYLLTENLFLAMGVHALWDIANGNAASIFSSNYTVIIIGLFALLLIYIKATGGKRKSKGIPLDR